MSVRRVKDPNDLLDYVVDYGAYWLPDGDFITEVSAFVDNDTLKIASQNFTNTKHTIWLSAGQTFETYQVTSRINTSEGRRRDFTFSIRVEDR